MLKKLMSVYESFKHTYRPTYLPMGLIYSPLSYLKEIATRNPICEALNYGKNHVLIIYTRHG
jgi:hypothetical protein